MDYYNGDVRYLNYEEVPISYYNIDNYRSQMPYSNGSKMNIKRSGSSSDETNYTNFKHVTEDHNSGMQGTPVDQLNKASNVHAKAPKLKEIKPTRKEKAIARKENPEKCEEGAVKGKGKRRSRMGQL